jgi:hypothetical protein
MRKMASEKRKELRVAVEGSVRIVLDEAGPEVILGRLMDTSASGFRASHSHAGLANGQTVQFQHAAAAGKARVVWNRITLDSVETGFLVV